MHAKGLISFAADPVGIGKYGGHHTFLHDGFQKWILAGQNGTGVQTVYCFHRGKPGVLQVYLYALWAL